MAVGKKASVTNVAHLYTVLRRAGEKDRARAEAQRLLDPAFAKTPSEINIACWAIVKDPAAPAELVVPALARLQSAAAEAPKNAALANTLAVALFRAGKFDEAVSAAHTRLASSKADGFSSDPSAGDHALLALVLNALGQAAQAKQALDSIPESLLAPPLDPDDAMLLEEARRALGRRE